MSKINNILTPFFQSVWQKKGLISTLLLPFAYLYEWAGKQRAKQPCVPLKCPVIVVGNIYVGGTGKTPVTIQLINDLKALGFHPGVVSRGYGATEIKNEPHLSGHTPLSPENFGDEPCLLAQYAPIAVHPNRVLAAQKLLAVYPEIDVIISDDGLQHRRLARDIEIIVQDSRGIGNGRVLPAGPLRESADRLNTVDFVLQNFSPLEDPDTIKKQYPNVPYGFNLKPVHFRHLVTQTTQPLEAFQGKTGLCVLAGIGNPQRFFNTLTQHGITAQTYLRFPDHYAFSTTDFDKITQDIILLTAKDAIKCPADPRIWVLEVQAQWIPGDFIEALLRQLNHKRSNHESNI
ncbi:tetraacyldisaccharide 4'-kinase [Basilea psittacipulmonis]|uniref:Tetraacyldisaccharide 4'-kinase n=1 Tax=Basilea psittacipulmonis DSM 24701 TaxID=1072685 RepID=A0A077DGV6_9BURK|nr:tetraacyldisaccharide 4'-kinase [Basilea psittacipulmonis]AIL32408.1 hypothetical protein IX83_02950 [Basilea psittacipulmonis DSM 24701]